MVSFGPYLLDQRTWTLSRDGELVDLSPRLVEILAHLISRGGDVVTRDELLERFWPDTYVGENTVTRAIADIRKALHDAAARPAFIQTRARRGYRFVASTSDGARTGGEAVPLASTDPLRQWVDGRLALESLDLSRLNDATRAFKRASAALPAYAPANAGLANAYLLQFEATRPANLPDRATISLALAAAREATRCDAHLGEAWAVLGHALALDGQPEEARAALLAAAALEPGNWRHHFRLALASWGEERLRAGDRTLSLHPECAAVRLLSAMVLVARGALDRAAREAEAGAAVQEQQQDAPILPAAGLHWIRGLVHCAHGDRDKAREQFERELSGNPGRVYGREFIVNAHLALGFVHWHGGDPLEAAAAFRSALSMVPGHARATLGLLLCGLARAEEVDAGVAQLAAGQKLAEAVLLRAARAAFDGRSGHAIGMLSDLLASAPPGPTAWSLRADPMWLALREAEGFGALLSVVAARAA